MEEIPHNNATPHARGRATLADYLTIARFDHGTKHIFIVPGMLLAYLLRGIRAEHVLTSILLGFAAAVCIASANYVINEWLDREFDKYHPKKYLRTAVQRELHGGVIFCEWLLFLCIGLGCAFLVHGAMLYAAVAFAAQGIFYNVRPMRTKDKPYLDVISESVNNPLRLTIGWGMIDPSSLPPSSLLLAYWLGGAFLMAAKRFSEYREISASHGTEILARYRASFAGYSDVTLLLSCFVHGLLSTFFLAIFLIKYRVEYILLIPVITAMFAYYLAMSLRQGSAAQNPEKLFRERALMLMVAALVAVFLLTTVVDFPVLSLLTEQHYILIP